MAATLFPASGKAASIAELVRPEPLPNGTEPEERVVFCGTSWDRYLALDDMLGNDCPGPRLYYLDGALEIMSTSLEHERITEWIGDLMTIYFDHADIDVDPHGQATMRCEATQSGAEPDKSWCLGEKELPDIVLEVALTSGGVDKLETYRRFQTPEVWIWCHSRLEVYILNAAGSAYEHGGRSRLFPNLDIASLERCMTSHTAREARRAFRASLAARE